MPKCRNCGSRLTKFDVDICPICGTKDPLKGVTSDTLEVTSEISLDADVSFRVCSKRNMLIFFATLGIFGAGFYYLKEVRKGLLWFLVHILAIAAIIGILFFLIEIPLEYSIVISVGVGYIYNIVIGSVMYLNPDLKDGEGEYVR